MAGTRGPLDSPFMSGKHLAEPQRRSLGQRLFLGLGIIVSFLLLAGASALGYFNYRFSQLTRYDVSIGVAPASGAPRNYLIVGSDSRAGLDPDDPANGGFFGDGISTGDTKRTDTIMVLRVAPEEEKAWLLSFPRDLYVPISDTGSSNRINVAFTRGREVLVNTIRQNFGIPIHHYIEVDFVGFIGLVNAIGGVPYYFDAGVRDENTGLDITEPGCVTLDARQSLAFARARHLQFQDPDTGSWRSDPTGDFGRISRQQAFIRKAISQAVSKGLGNPTTLNQLVGVAVDNVGLDPTLDASDMLSLARRFASFDPDTLQTYSVPATATQVGGASVLDVNQREAEPIFNVFRGLDPDEISDSLIEVTVFNGTEQDHFAADITAAFEEIGFATGTPADTPEPVAETTVFYGSDNEAAASRVGSFISGPVQFEMDENLGDAEIELWAGADFTTLHDQPSPEPPEVVPPTTASGSAEESTTTTTAPTTTTTEPLGFVPDDAPEGVECG